VTQRGQVALTSRAFCLAAVFLLSVVTDDRRTVLACLVVLVAGAASVYVSRLLGTMSVVALTAETFVVASVMGYYARDSFILMPYLVVLTLLAGLFASAPAVLLTLAAQVIGLSVALLVTGRVDAVTTIDIAWLLTTCGGGLLGIWARSLGPPGIRGETDAHYESARQLLTQLRAVTRRLSAGLDSDGMSAQLMETVSERLECRYAAVFVKTSSSVLIPLGFRGPGASQVLSPTDPIVARCWASGTPVHGVVASGDREARHRTALPLRLGNRMIGVAFCSSSEPADEAAVAPLMEELDAHSLRLDTALVFDEIRTLATADERQRLAREIHDGIAQEVASLGYAVDELAATSTDPQVAEGLHGLRRELSRVVADLRLSIFDLRSDVSPTNGLGAALSDYVRQVGAKSDLTVHLTLDEAPTRLTPAVEGELLRIAQEAVTNARKHASADNLWVDFWTDPPRARLVVRDDGTGMSGGRDDSYGISIMRERAERIDATLDIVTDSRPDPAHGTQVQVTVASDRLPLEEGIRVP
jgi:signal transduction histidine kinase